MINCRAVSYDVDKYSKPSRPEKYTNFKEIRSLPNSPTLIKDEQLLFCGEDVWVSYIPGDGSSVVFTFSGFQSHLQQNPRFGSVLLHRMNVDRVFFVAVKDHWWQTSEMSEAIAVASAVLPDCLNRVAYGHSMGAFGAIQFASRLGARFIASAPQVTVDTNVAPLRAAWAECVARYPRLHDNVLTGDIRAAGIVVFDPRDSYDSIHVNLLRDWPCQYLIFPFATHYVPRALSESDIISKITIGLLTNSRSLGDLRKIIRKRRVYSQTYVKNLMSSLSRLGKANHLAAVARIVRKRGGQLPDGD